MKVTDRRVSAWREAHPEDKSCEWDLFVEEHRTVVVHDRAGDTIDTGLLDRDGNSIHRCATRPIGFVVFD